MIKAAKDDYFNSVRTDIALLLPDKIDKAIEIGCGSGNTLQWLKKERSCRWTCGVELSLNAATKAKDKVDLLIEGDIEKIELPLEKETFDLLLCLDVLEHLIDPWNVLKKLSFYVKRNGVVIVSIPNVRNINVLGPLIIRGRWNYRDQGLLDLTHLRFFTKKTAINLVECSGFKIDKVLFTGLELNSKKGILNILTLGVFRSFLESQFLIKAIKS
jgi:2-polyprenyl-3-methyl-5-hydroxy-6-metoxy-1,4-benzoquinol methylase